MAKHSNHLVAETSPYLLQHAHNPVDWYPWGEDALKRAREENKPILVSIGYAACHWCHVMERESFEDESTAQLMNEHFINIKIDREERPDLDHIYMDAVQAMTGSGGWPLNVFLTPDTKPFYGGTYFPPQRAFNRPSWKETLEAVVDAFSKRRHEIDAQAENLTGHLLQSNSFGLQQTKEEETISKQSVESIFQNIMRSADRVWGGFGKAPKFPQSFSIQFLLRYHHQYGNEEALDQALLSLDKMIEGGIYDQVGGGFARYSTDTEWLAPHFEKMLYDNALLLSVLAEAYQMTGIEKYREVIDETMEFIQRELLHEKGGFFAALDADSEGEEGKFYVWQKQEVQELLGEDAAIFCAYYDVTDNGNWEEKNILRVKKKAEDFIGENNITIEDIKRIIESGKKKLLAARNKRIRPLLDDKIILGWNALMNSACSRVFAATGDEKYRQLAKDNMKFLLENFAGKSGNALFHTWKNDVAKYPAFLDDYAFLIRALMDLQEITAERKWLIRAKELTEHVNANFSEEETGFYFYTSVEQEDVIIRKKEVYDGAVPSGNSMMALNLHQLSILFDKTEWRNRSLDMVLALGNAVIKYPTSFGNWSALLLELLEGTNEIVILAKDPEIRLSELVRNYIPHRVLMASKNEEPDFPLLRGKNPTEETSYYLCRNSTCLPAVFSVNELISLINNARGRQLILS